MNKELQAYATAFYLLSGSKEDQRLGGILLRQLFASDSETNLFMFRDSPHKAKYIDRTIDFQSGSSIISIVDQFAGKEPLVLNQANLSKWDRGESYTFGFQAEIILDSHLMDLIYKYVYNRNNGLRSEESKDWLKVTEEFLRFTVSKNIQLNPFFYYLEAYFKSTKENFEQYAFKYGLPIVELQCMDRQKFLENGIITPDPLLLEAMKERFEASSLEEIAHNRLRPYLDSGVSSSQMVLTRAPYACLIKMVLIEKARPELSLMEKLELLYDFMKHELKTIYSRELEFATYYFANKVGRFIGIEKSTKFDDALRKLRSSAWDIFLLRQPEATIMSEDRILTFSYVCTAEKILRKLGEHFVIAAIITNKNFSPPTLPFIEFRHEALALDLGDVVADKIWDWSGMKAKKRLAKPEITEKHPDANEMGEIILDLEVELAQYCS